MASTQLDNKKPPCWIRLLGPPVITWQTQSFSLARRQARGLLYRLADDLYPAPRDQLIFLLWPDTPETTARRNLIRLLSYIHQALPQPELLLSDHTTIALNPDLIGSDTVQFVRLGAANDVAGWETVVSLYQGRFLDGFSLSDTPEFDHWLSQSQRQYERAYLDVLGKLVTIKADRGDYPAAIQYAQQYLAADDLAEEIHRQLITLYAAQGDRIAALRQFEQCAIVLERELGVPPLPETRAAYETVRDGASAPTPKLLPKPEWTTLPGLELPLIGRDEAWQALTAAYRRYRRGGVIFISGEAGVGKSRLMQEFATTQSGLVLTGNSHATGQALSYQPLAQALRLALPLRDRWSHTLPIWLAEVSRLLPELRAHFPNLPPPVEVAPQQAQARLFEALTEVFGSLATDSPLLLCLDDVHWADEATLGWLQYTTKWLAGRGVCILATYRSHEAHELAEWQRALSRAGQVTNIRLTGLSETAVTDLLGQADLNRTTAAPLGARIHAATGGNAFFVLETIRELLETGKISNGSTDLPLPQTVRDAVLRRAGRLTPLTQQIMAVAAVLSPHLRIETLVEASGRSELETVDSLEELLAHQLLQADGVEFRFHHDLARQAVYEEISPWRLRLQHRRVAQALAGLPDPDEAGLPATIAAHFEAAGEVAQAIAYYRQAATLAQQLYIHQDAIAYLRQAIKLSAELSEAAAMLPELYEALADNLTVAGHFALAEEMYRTALSQVSESERLRRAELQHKLAETLPPQQRGDEAIALRRVALTLVQERNDRGGQQVRLNILLGLMDALYYQLQAETMAELAGQTQALLDDVGTAMQQAHFYSQLNQMAMLKEKYRLSAETVTLAQKALAYAQEASNAWQINHQHFGLGFNLLWHGDLAGAEAVLQETLALAGKLGDQWSQTQCLVYLTILYRLRGDTTQVGAYLPRLVEAGQTVGTPFYMAVSQANTAWLHHRNGQFLSAQKEALAALSTWDNSPYPFQWLAYWIVLAMALKQESLSEAIEAARAMLAPTQQKLPDDVTEALEMASQTWESDNGDIIQERLRQVVELAGQYGYL
ncbi:MAG: transcriptional activator [Chloroflexota bacterium]|nr:MAG: transcriptional activator [Chloroflexota bacterium]